MIYWKYLNKGLGDGLVLLLDDKVCMDMLKLYSGNDVVHIYVEHACPFVDLQESGVVDEEPAPTNPPTKSAKTPSKSPTRSKKPPENLLPSLLLLMRRYHLEILLQNPPKHPENHPPRLQEPVEHHLPSLRQNYPQKYPNPPLSSNQPRHPKPLPVRRGGWQLRRGVARATNPLKHQCLRGGR